MMASSLMLQDRLNDPARLCPILAGIGKISGDRLKLRLAEEVLEVAAPARYLDKLFDWCQGELSLEQIGERALAHFGDREFSAFIADMLSAGVLVDASLGLPHFARMLEKSGKRLPSSSLPPAVAAAAASLPPPGGLIGLGVPPVGGLLSLASARSSASGFGGGAVSKACLNALLFAAYGCGESGRRVVASAGGLYPLTLYLVLLSRIEDISAGSYKVHFNDGAVQLEALPSSDVAQVPRALSNPAIMRGAAGWLLITADIRAGALKYGSRAFSHVMIEAGSVVQNVALAATEQACAWSAMGVIDTPHASALFGCDPALSLPIIGGLFGNVDAGGADDAAKPLRSPQIHFEWMDKHDALPFHTGQAFIAGPSPGALVRGHGRDADPARAYDKAIAEAVERYAYRQPRDCHAAQWGELPGMLLPQSLVGYSPSQHRSTNFPYHPFEPARQYLWREAVEIATGTKHWVPAECVYALSSLPARYRVHPLTSANSSGCASGRSEQAAQKAALFEVVERDAFMRHWFAQRGGKGVRLASLPIQWASRINELSRKGCRVSLQMLDLGLFPVWFFFVQNAERHFTAVSAAAAADGEHALESAFSEIETAVSARMGQASGTGQDPQRVESTDDHAELYTHPSYFRRADALGKPVAEIDYGAALDCFARHATDIALRLRDAGTFAVWVDMTLPDTPVTIDGTPLISGRILVPHAIPISFGYGRMPLAMDMFSTPQARFPHPFP
ncbi:YcaO-like family protein [Herbaspirillum sp. alder98]|uniref:YcaO-like family protein n=1 Tax=Herbaspirillum sp. alder98 TaxID=2913096 RepID=UPI001CD8F65B|nr:YcaO-like family protein [Herbaspirillum sp. alder98]MCA1323484.1 YcaO-like family protein [Herbaspirillum sp. alder98]